MPPSMFLQSKQLPSLTSEIEGLQIHYAPLLIEINKELLQLQVPVNVIGFQFQTRIPMHVH